MDNEKMADKLRELSIPIHRLLWTDGDPHCTVIITQDGVRLLRDELEVPMEFNPLTDELKNISTKDLIRELEDRDEVEATYYTPDAGAAFSISGPAILLKIKCEQ